ncbi:P-loop NTPase [Bacillus pinisoli]|uniref:P-loop NTPase n=1 Tax=Bacillus pinisoli TaxID=2901866 RepID=UPI001FF2B4D0|nr:P-loop NTPase [Bacillus pinisoli]
MNNNPNFKQIDFTFLFYMLSKWKWTIASVLLGSILITVMTCYVFIKPMYEANAKILITVAEEQRTQNINLDTQTMNTYREMINTSVILKSVQTDLQEYKLSIKELKENIDVTFIQETPLMKITVKGDSIEKSEAIMKSLIEVVKVEITKLSGYRYELVELEVPNGIDMDQKPVSPNYSFIIMITVILTFGLTFTIILFKEVYEERVGEEEDFRKMGVQTFTPIPHIWKSDLVRYISSLLKRNQYPLINQTDIPVKITQSFNVLYNQLKNQKFIIVTSSKAGEGKTFVASNLAISYALQQKKVLLVDANIVSPKLHTIFQTTNDSDSQRLYKNIILLTADSIKSHAQNNILSTSTLLQLFNVFTEKNVVDVIIIDAPSAEHAFQLQSICFPDSKVLMVVGQRSVTKKELRNSILQIKGYNVSVIGTVLNKTRNLDKKFFRRK